MQTTQGKHGAQERTLDLIRIAQILWKRAWVIVLVVVVVAGMVFAGTKLFVAPLYSSSFTAYVNNRQSTAEGQGVTNSGDISASRNLTYLYEEIIVSRSVLMGAVEACDLPYSYSQVKSMVNTSVSTTAAIITVTVENENPQQAQDLASAIAVAAAQNVERIVDGSSMRLIDSPVLPTSPFAPNAFRKALVGAAVALALCIVIVILLDMIVDNVNSPKELEERHGLVVVGTIPDVTQASKPVYGAAANSSRRQ